MRALRARSGWSIPIAASARARRRPPSASSAVTVGDPGNANDVDRSQPAGSTDDLPRGIDGVRLPDLEVRSDELAVRRDANATSQADTNGLYDANMTSSAERRDQIGAASPAAQHSVKTGFENKPVNYVTCPRRAAHRNWLGIGQPTGAQGAGTTEGGPTRSRCRGSYRQRDHAKHAGRRIFVPTENEWMKAGYSAPCGRRTRLADQLQDGPGSRGADRQRPDAGRTARRSTAPTAVVGCVHGSASVRTETRRPGRHVCEWTDDLKTGAASAGAEAVAEATPRTAAPGRRRPAGSGSRRQLSSLKTRSAGPRNDASPSPAAALS